MSGRVKLPSEKAMLKDIEKKQKYNESRYYSGPRNTLQVDWINCMDVLAELVGCKPKVFKHLFKDPKLWWQLVSGPCYPYQYRLRGPHKWEGARDCLLKASERIKAPLFTRELTDKNSQFIVDKTKFLPKGLKAAKWLV
jgi:dimethylaniline monooxygenase (N-oxide forming)